MAEFSDEEMKRQVAEDTKTEKIKDKESRVLGVTNLISAAVILGILAFLIALPNYYSLGIPYSSTIFIGGIVIVIASAAIVVGLARYRTSIM